MDKKDTKILYEISENARDSRNVLARRVGVSREVLDYRIKKLKEEGIITGFQARISISNFVYGGYILLIQSLDLTKESEDKILKKIENNGNTQYIGRLGGGYDFIIGFTVKDLFGLSDYVNFINSVFSNHKSKLTFLTMVKEFKDSFKNIFSESEQTNDFVSMSFVKEKLEIDSIDKKILQAFGKDCSVPSWGIAEKCKITEVAIRKRIKKLIDKKIILGFRTMLNLTKLGYEPNFIFIKLNIKDKESEKSLVDFFKKNKNITYATKLIGEQDYAITVLSKSNMELNNFILDLRNKFKGMVVGVENYPLFEMIYHTQLAEGFLE
mgnify:CR=1 FL=1